jgi:hypothetical protein
VKDDAGTLADILEAIDGSREVSQPRVLLRDESLEDMHNLPAPEVIAAEIVEDLEAALAQYAEIAASLASDKD